MIWNTYVSYKPQLCYLICHCLEHWVGLQNEGKILSPLGALIQCKNEIALDNQQTEFISNMLIIIYIFNFMFWIEKKTLEISDKRPHEEQCSEPNERAVTLVKFEKK